MSIRWVMIGLLGAFFAATAQAEECPRCSVYQQWLIDNDRTCTYQGARLPSICDLDPECLHWNKECNRVKAALGECLRNCQEDAGKPKDDFDTAMDDLLANGIDPDCPECDASQQQWLLDNDQRCHLAISEPSSLCDRECKDLIKECFRVAVLHNKCVAQCRIRIEKAALDDFDRDLVDLLENGIDPDQPSPEECRRKAQELSDADSATHPFGAIGYILFADDGGTLESCTKGKGPASGNTPVFLGDCITTGVGQKIMVNIYRKRDEWPGLQPDLANVYDAISPEVMPLNVPPMSQLCFSNKSMEIQDTRVPILTTLMDGLAKSMRSNSIFSVRAGTTICGIRGTEYVVERDAASGVTKWHVAEGQVRVLDLESGEKRDVLAGQTLAHGAGAFSKPSTLTRQQWDDLAAARDLSPPARPHPAGRAIAIDPHPGFDAVGGSETPGKNGQEDVAFRAAIRAPGRIITSIEVRNTNGVFSVWDTIPNNGMWLGALKPGPKAVNRSDGSVSFALGSEEVEIDFLCEDANILRAGQIAYRMTVFFDDGEQLAIDFDK